MIRFKFIILAIIFISLSSFTLDSRTEKKLNKEINSIWNIEEYSLNLVETEQLPEGDNIYQLISGDSLIGFVYLGQANSRSDKIDYSVIYDSNASIKKVNIIKYRENYGGEIGSKRWLKQFIGKQNGEQMKYKHDISAISGATISVREMINAVNKSSIWLYQNKETFYGTTTRD